MSVMRSDQNTGPSGRVLQPAGDGGGIKSGSVALAAGDGVVGPFGLVRRPPGDGGEQAADRVVQARDKAAR